MKLTAVLGSPRQGGNTDILLTRALGGAKAKGIVFEKIILNDLNIRPCQECASCLKTGICRIQDDMAVLYKKFDESDIIIVASPIFFGSVSSQTKIMVDRMQCYWARKFVLKKNPDKKNRKGAFVSCGGLETEGYFKCARKVVNIFFKVQDIEYAEELFASGVDKKGDILKHEDILLEAYELGKRLISMKHTV